MAFDYLCHLHKLWGLAHYLNDVTSLVGNVCDSVINMVIIQTSEIDGRCMDDSSLEDIQNATHFFQAGVMGVKESERRSKGHVES